jgi:hypothetical protein
MTVEPDQRAVGGASTAEQAGDVLTWRLARRVMLDHEFDVASPDGSCRVCRQLWPCDAWRRAEHVATQFKPWDSPAS